MRENDITVHPPTSGLARELGRDETRLHAWNDQRLLLHSPGTHFGYIHSGRAEIETGFGRFTLGPGMYFSVPRNCCVDGDGTGMVVTHRWHPGVFRLGGPIHAGSDFPNPQGHADRFLLGPGAPGDPHLNLLRLPPGTEHTPRSRPSLQVGMVANGHGLCRTTHGEIPLGAGALFSIPRDVEHAFSTTSESLTMIVYHPSSEVGLTDYAHPRLDPIIVRGESAQRAP